MAWCLDHSGDFDGRQLAVVVFRVSMFVVFVLSLKCKGAREPEKRRENVHELIVGILI